MSGSISQGPGGGIVPPGSAPVNPMAANLAQRYNGLSTEQLQELASRTGASPQGQIAGRALMQRHLMPNATPAPQATSPGISSGPTGTPIPQTQQATSAGIGLPPTTNAMQRGGEIGRAHFDIGGFSAGEETPWYTKAEARGEDQGLVHAYSPGRTDTMNMEPLAGSYILPADVVSGLGEGNTLAGAAAMDRALSSGPRGIPDPRGEHGRGPPAPPRIVSEKQYAGGGRTARKGNIIRMADGGKTGERVPIVIAGGEYVVHPDQVRALGGGDIRHGHDVLDAFVLHQRAQNIKDQQKLPGPKGATKNLKKAA